MKLKKCGLIFALVLSLLFAGCNFTERTPLTAREFVDRMEEKGYVLVDVSDQYEDGLVEHVLIALKGDDYQIEFFVLPSVEQTRAAYYQNTQTAEEDPDTRNVYSEINVLNYAYYTRSGDHNYFICRIDNTMIYANVGPDFSAEAKETIRSLGYFDKERE